VFFAHTIISLELNVLIPEHHFLPIIYLRTEGDGGQMVIQRPRAVAVSGLTKYRVNESASGI